MPEWMRLIVLASSNVRFKFNRFFLFRSGNPNFYQQNATSYLNPMYNPNMPAQYPPNPNLPNMNYNPNLQRRQRRQRPPNQEPMGASNAVNTLVRPSYCPRVLSNSTCIFLSFSVQ